MNILAGILDREYIKPDTKLNIIWNYTDNQYFAQHIQKLGHSLVSFDHIYFMSTRPHLILCNDRLSSYEKCNQLSLELHLPVLVVDHSTKNPLASAEQVQIANNFYCSYSVAINADISNSWDKIHNEILPYNNDPNNIIAWNSLLYQVSKRIFTIL